MSLIVYALIAFGFAYIVGHSRISRATREWLHKLNPVTRLFIELVECPACLGFWYGVVAGFLAAFIRLPLYIFEVDVPPILGVFALALFTSATNFILGRVTGIMGDS